MVQFRGDMVPLVVGSDVGVNDTQCDTPVKFCSCLGDDGGKVVLLVKFGRNKAGTSFPAASCNVATAMVVGGVSS